MEQMKEKNKREMDNLFIVKQWNPIDDTWKSVDISKPMTFEQANKLWRELYESDVYNDYKVLPCS